jgi:hypothetical protein
MSSRSAFGGGERPDGDWSHFGGRYLRCPRRPLIIIAVAEADSTLYETDNRTASGATSANDSGSGA